MVDLFGKVPGADRAPGIPSAEMADRPPTPGEGPPLPMHTAHRPLPQNPFETHGPDHAWFPGGDHDEALSRMLYLIERGRGCGLIHGATGMGKSRVLREIQRLARTMSATIVAVNLTGLDRTGFAGLCANGCGGGFNASTSPSLTWTFLEDWLRGRGVLRHRVIWLMDDVDAAREPLARELVRLARLGEHTGTPSVVIAAAERFDDERVLRDEAEFRMALTPWDESTSRAFVSRILIDAGRSAELLTASAWTELMTAAAGHPGRLLRMMEIALAAGGVLQSPHVTSELLTAVADQLGWRHHSALLQPVD